MILILKGNVVIDVLDASPDGASFFMYKNIGYYWHALSVDKKHGVIIMEDTYETNH